MTNARLKKRIEDLAANDERYRPDAYLFILDALDFISSRLGKSEMAGCDRHVSVDELLEGVKAFALDQFGPLARMVLEHFGIFSTEDVGEIVFNMVEAELLNSQDTDTREDFANGYDFKEVFEERYSPEMPW
jgi:uncharacterized repeat protein (TIGR04138 family)